MCHFYGIEYYKLWDHYNWCPSHLFRLNMQSVTFTHQLEILFVKFLSSQSKLWLLIEFFILQLPGMIAKRVLIFVWCPTYLGSQNWNEFKQQLDYSACEASNFILSSSLKILMTTYFSCTCDLSVTNEFCIGHHHLKSGASLALVICLKNSLVILANFNELIQLQFKQLCRRVI